MAYFIFAQNSDGIEGTISRIAENQIDLNNLNININCYKIIEDTKVNFDLVKYGQKTPKKYNGNIITYEDIIYEHIFSKKGSLLSYVENYTNNIKNFLQYNKNHPEYNTWNSYLTQLSNLNLDNVIYPLGKSLEQYFKDQNQPSLSPLQLP
jgi:hypothetical protein